MTPRPIVLPFGDSAVLVEIGDDPGVETSRRLRALARQIRTATEGQSGWSIPIPAATSILVPVDPVEPGAELAAGTLRSIVDAAHGDMAGPGDDEGEPVIEIPVRYGGEDGPDLETVADLTGLSAIDVVDIHAAATYTALFLGFAPGFAYLGPLDQRLVLGRKDVPRQRVPAGSVAIAGPQTAVYPVDSPGGWWILGRTSVPVWEPSREPAALLRPGSRVRFVPERR